MQSEYLSETSYTHPLAKLTVSSTGNIQGVCNLYGMASFLITCGYCAYRETTDNGAAPRSRVEGILGDWLTPDKERQLFLRHRATLNNVTEEIADRLSRLI